MSTHLALYYHLVWSTKNREPWMTSELRARMHAKLGGLAHGLKAMPLEIGGVADHVHVLIGLRATHRVCDVLRDLKHESSRWVHETMGMEHFDWQDGYGAFTVSPWGLEKIRSYIVRQEEHHQTRGYQEEYLDLLHQHGIEYDERYLW